MFRRVSAIALLSVFSLHAQNTPQAKNNNDELTQLFDEDQRVRSPEPPKPDEPKVTRTDADRLVRVKQMIANGQIQTTADYFHAALIVQHSPVSSDYLLAHSLSVVCASEGNKTCLWLSAATLDRYLQSIQQPQIYGTQFIAAQKAPATQQPYADGIIPDSIRKRLGVPTRDEQEKQLDSMNSRVR